VAAALRERTEPGSLVITATGGNPTMLYLSRRKGWTVAERELTPALLDAKRNEGARYLAGTGPVPAGLATPRSRFLINDDKGYVLSLE
jgi:hypothetical protein